MTDGRTELRADVCVVGAGVVGLAHALEARRRGLRVVLLERDDRSVGASVRNFGHLFVSCQPDGPALELALRSRERWLELAQRAGLGLVRAGTLVIARAEDELAVLETALAEPARQARMLSAAEALALAPLPGEGILGALHTPLDLRVDPRAAVAALARLLAEDPGAQLRWASHVHAVAPGEVHAHGPAGALRVRAATIVVCPGPDHASLAPELRPGLEGLTRCRLQMLAVSPPGGRRYAPALMTGLSLLRYPAFCDQAPTVALRARLEREVPELLEAGIHLIITQRPDGSLIVGDSHAYADCPSAFGEERIWELLLAQAEALLGGPLSVRERWLGIYPSRAEPDVEYEPFHVTRPMPGVAVVENVAGIGMTLSPAFAAGVLDDLAADVAQPGAASPS